MNKILFDTFKIAFAALISILIAYFIQLEFYISAGIVTILTIQSTKRHTFQTALERLIAFVLALLIASVCFRLAGYTIAGYGLYLLIYIFFCQLFKWNASMAVNSVLISHFLTFQNMTFSSILNEAGLFMIGVSVGVIVNLHLRKDLHTMNRLKNQTDDQIRYILQRMSERILYPLDDYDGNCFDKLNRMITYAKIVSIENENNALIHKDSYDHNYIKMREHQTQILYEMYKLCRHLNTTPITAKLISDFLYLIQEEYHKDNNCSELLDHFYILNQQMKELDLPIDRKEFEDRARLYGLMCLIEEFLLIKKEFLLNL